MQPSDFVDSRKKDRGLSGEAAAKELLAWARDVNRTGKDA